jgi:exonuclease VII large subunit
VSDAEAQLAAVDRELADFTAAAGTPVPDRDYEILANQISSLQTQRAQAAASDQAIVAERLGQEIASKQQQLGQMAGTLKTYNGLQSKRTTAIEALNSARQRLTQASAEFAAGDPTRTVTGGETVKLSVVGPTLKGGVTALVAGLFFAGGIALLLELRRHRRLARHEVEAEADSDVQAVEADAPLAPTPVGQDNGDGSGSKHQPALTGESVQR